MRAMFKPTEFDGRFLMIMSICKHLVFAQRHKEISRVNRLSWLNVFGRTVFSALGFMIFLCLNHDFKMSLACYVGFAT